MPSKLHDEMLTNMLTTM